ncbi:MAG: sporulation initiation factor Spo0A C-terminal domain-containing protein [Desulfosporosinus sp.]
MNKTTNKNEDKRTDADQRKYALEVYSIIHQLGIPAHLRGYEMIKTAMNELYDDPDMIYAMTRELYPAVAEIHNREPEQAERNIRHAIEASRADDETWRKVLGAIRPMCNSEFLATMGEVIRIKMAGVA